MELVKMPRVTIQEMQTIATQSLSICANIPEIENEVASVKSKLDIILPV